ncbi:MAG: molybdopterin-dependent oxidoreductase [Acidimicrobiia bacterium]
MPQHGSPLRLVVPGWYGMTHVKWLSEIRVLAEPFRGYQQSIAYRIRQSDTDPGTPVTRIAARSLMVSPGFPDFLDAIRSGRAWSGWGPVARVGVSTDGGSSWSDAEVGEVLSPMGGRREPSCGSPRTEPAVLAGA